MANVQIWGRVQRLGPMEFVAIVTAMPDNGSRPQVEMKTYGTTQEAYKAVEEMAVSVSAQFQREGAKIVDILIE